MLKSLKQIVTKLEDFSDDHKQIEEFAFGNTDNITTSEHIYPMLWVTENTHTISDNLITLRFDMLMLDL